MKKELICAFLAVMLLASCSGGDGGNTDGTDTREPVTAGVSDSGTADPEESADVTTDPSEVTTPASPGNDEVTLPEGVPELPEDGDTGVTGAVMYSDENVVVQVGESGSRYVNGEQVPIADASSIIQQILYPDKTKLADTATETAEPAVSGSTGAVSGTTTGIATRPVVHIPVNTAVPDLPTLTETERPAVTIDGTDEIFYLAKYVESGDTELDITEIKVFSSGKPGVAGVDAFRPGESLLINIRCDTDALDSATMYIVHEEAEHKASYAHIECFSVHPMVAAVETGDGQIFMEVVLPEEFASGIYELRFCCGGEEEGYIPFYFG